MKANKSFRVMGLLYGLLVAGLFLSLPNGAVCQDQQVSGAMFGFVFGEDARTPVENAVLKIRNTRTGNELTCEPTDKNGMFTLKDVAEGRYILGVSSGEQDFNFGYTVLVKSGEIAHLALALKPGKGEELPEREANIAPPAPDVRDMDFIFPDSEGEAVIGPDNGMLIINCIGGHKPPKPPKPPKSKHKPHHHHDDGD